MPKRVDITGQRYGRLVAIKKVEPDSNGRARWLYKCDCGNEFTTDMSNVRRGKTKSCGCLKNDNFKKYLLRHNKTHGMTGTRIYNIWKSMISRCYNPKNIGWNHYGGRGITICEEWRNSPEIFRDWAMDHGYQDNLSIDRKENDKGYCPDNCRWVSMKRQTNNKSNNRLITFNGKTMTLSEWAEFTGFGVSTLLYRLDSGWTVKDTLTILPAIGASSHVATT